MSFSRRLGVVAEQIGAAAEEALGRFGDDRVSQAMRYALTGGKRLRGYLVLESAALHGVDPARAMPAAVAIEALHAFSLVHDDLPSMDDDDMRRGQPTVHVKWDEATAVLAGDALQTFAFECLAELDLPAVNVVSLVAALARASGAAGMVLGQAQDIAAESRGGALTLAEIEELQSNKTGALIEWSAIAGPLMAGDDPARLRDYARALGRAFQIADDILDSVGDEAVAGKRLQKDAAAGKATFVSLLGLEAARARARALVEEAETRLTSYGARADGLREAARFVIARDH